MCKAFFSSCPRCGTKSFENLRTHSHCVNCLYSEDSYEDSESRAFKASEVEKQTLKLKFLKPTPKKFSEGEAA